MFRLPLGPFQKISGNKLTQMPTRCRTGNQGDRVRKFINARKGSRRRSGYARAPQRTWPGFYHFAQAPRRTSRGLPGARFSDRRFYDLLRGLLTMMDFDGAEILGRKKMSKITAAAAHSSKQTAASHPQKSSKQAKSSGGAHPATSFSSALSKITSTKSGSGRSTNQA
jgi:hypothetical protein